MRLRPFAPLLLAFAGACASGSAAPPATTAPPPAGPVALPVGVETITATDFRARIGFLADDALLGRDTPSQGLEVAAAYIASEFLRLGLEPAGDAGSYLQRWPYVTRSLEGDASSLGLAGAGPAPELAFGRDFWVASGGDTPVEAAVTVFAAMPGPNTPVPDALAGRIAVVALPGSARDAAAGAFQALRALQVAGAAGVIFVLDPSVGPDVVAARAQTGTTMRGRGAAMPAFYVRRAPLDELFTAGGAHLGGLLQRAGAASVAVPDLRLRLDAPIREIEHRPPNAVAILRGSDPQLRDTYVVFSAHMDHVGVGAPDASGDSIYNGADDDASGTSAVLELAEAFASLPEPPARSLVFLAVSGEEKGLLGSAYYADHPTVPIESIVANVNIDMISRNAPDSAVVIGQEYSSLGPLAVEITRAHPELGLNIGPDPWPEERFFFRSDHFNFARREIPALFFFTGTHEDYHRPSDEVDRVDTDKAARITRLIFHIGQTIADDPEPPAWTPEGLQEVRLLTRQGR